jgi:hypothetical protein
VRLNTDLCDPAWSQRTLPGPKAHEIKFRPRLTNMIYRHVLLIIGKQCVISEGPCNFPAVSVQEPNNGRIGTIPSTIIFWLHKLDWVSSWS